MATATKIKLGQAVTYIDSKGHEKAAIVIGTPESVVEGTSLSPLEDGQLNLFVIAPHRGPYNRLNVPSAESASDLDGEAASNSWKL